MFAWPMAYIREAAESDREQTDVDTGRNAVSQWCARYWMVCPGHYEAALLSTEARYLPEQFWGLRKYCTYAVNIAHSCGPTDTPGKIIGTLAFQLASLAALGVG